MGRAAGLAGVPVLVVAVVEISFFAAGFSLAAKYNQAKNAAWSKTVKILAVVRVICSLRSVWYVIAIKI